jgi:UDPglucose 6-dehydrogenase
MHGAGVIGFAGLSHLGLVSSFAAAARGAAVVAFDADPRRCEALARGEFPVHEPGLPDLVAAHGARVHLTARQADLARCDLVFFSLDVPTNDRNDSDLGPLEALIETAAPALRPGAVRVVLSQVPPGFTRAQGLDYCQVETLIFGRAVERALHPERIIVGCADPSLPLPAAYADYLARFDCPVLPMRYESAELAKIAINMFLVSSVSTTNTLAEICEVTGAEWQEIAPALRLDRRIGPHAYLSPGLGLSGGNLERDLATVRRLAAERGSDASVVDAWIANSTRRRSWVLEHLRRERPAGGTLAIWGLAYKPDTASTRNSPALLVLDALRGEPVTVYDPAAELDGARYPRARRAATALAACEGADVLVVMTPWREFSDVDPHAIAAAMRGRVVIDPYGAIDRSMAAHAGLTHHRLGSSVPPPPAPRC